MDPDRPEMTATVHLVGVRVEDREQVATMLSNFLLRALYYIQADRLGYTITVDGVVHKEGGR